MVSFSKSSEDISHAGTALVCSSWMIFVDPGLFTDEEFRLSFSILDSTRAGIVVGDRAKHALRSMACAGEQIDKLDSITFPHQLTQDEFVALADQIFTFCH